MIQFNISIIPKKLQQINLHTFNGILKQLKNNIIRQLENSIDKDHFNIQRSLRACLLLTHYLLRDQVNFNSTLNEIKANEPKVRDKDQLYFDLLILQSEKPIVQNHDLLNSLAYDKLIATYVKWNLLFQNLLKIKYDAQINHLSKAGWNATPAQCLIILELMIDWLYRLPSKGFFLKIIKTKLNQTNKELNHFWNVRSFDSTSIKRKQAIIKVAIWDTGVDRNSIQNISSNLYLSFDKNCQPVKAPLMPLEGINEQEWTLYKGFLDLKFAKESKAATFFLEVLAQFDQEDMIKLKRIVNQLIVHCHGTSVASVVSQKNPNIEIIPIRISFDANQAFPTLYTAKRIKNEIKMQQLVFNWLNLHKIPIVNISWNHRIQDIGTSLMNTGMMDKQKRTRLAKELFTTLKKSLYEGIKACSNTLFVVGAGNSNSIVEEEGFIPSSFNLPNLITVGAVNHQGKRTGFTSIGKHVNIYANGSYVNTIIPNGYQVKSSGTSIAAPQVCNLAAIILSIFPKMPILSLKKWIIENADIMAEEEILVLNPQKTMEQILKNN